MKLKEIITQLCVSAENRVNMEWMLDQSHQVVIHTAPNQCANALSYQFKRLRYINLFPLFPSS